MEPKEKKYFELCEKYQLIDEQKSNEVIGVLNVTCGFDRTVEILKIAVDRGKKINILPGGDTDINGISIDGENLNFDE